MPEQTATVPASKMARIRNLYTIAYAWRTHDYLEDGHTDLSGLRAKQQAEFDVALAEHDQEVAEAASRQAVKQHAQMLMDTQREVVTEAVVDAELRGYARKVNERITEALDRPRTILTPKEADALPLRSLIREHDGFHRLKEISGSWLLCIQSGGLSASDELEYPAEVLYTPEVR